MGCSTIHQVGELHGVHQFVEHQQMTQQLLGLDHLQWDPIKIALQRLFDGGFQDPIWKSGALQRVVPQCVGRK